MSASKKHEDNIYRGGQLKSDNGDYLLSYTRHLEKRLRTLENEKNMLEFERRRILGELNLLRKELERLRMPPLIAATIVDKLPDGRVIVKSTTGPKFIVKVSERIPEKELIPGTAVALAQRSFAVVEILPPAVDTYVKGTEIIEAPDVTYEDIGGLEEQLREVRETVELPLTHPELFDEIGIEPPGGVLLFGPPGTGKTLVVKAIANKTSACFIRIIGSELVRKFIGEGARLVRDIFKLARERAPAIIFIDEIDAIGSRRLEGGTSGDREVQRTMLQLLSELDGFDNRENIRIIAATNRPDILDPALTRPGRFDRHIEFPLPNKKGRIEIFKIHTRKLKMDRNIDIEELAAKTEGATGAEIRAICIEAGMNAIRHRRKKIIYADFLYAVKKVMAADKKENPRFYT